jgi:hypothetical protein
VVPRKTAKRPVTTESSSDHIPCSQPQFNLFPQVSEVGCIEFLNRERRFDSSRGHNPKPKVKGASYKGLDRAVEPSGPVLVPLRTRSFLRRAFRWASARHPGKRTSTTPRTTVA